MTGNVKGCVHYGLRLYNNVSSNLLIHICSVMFYNAETELTNLSTGCLYTQIHPTGIFNCVRQLAHRLIQLMSANRLHESLQKVCLRPLVDWMKSGFGQHLNTLQVCKGGEVRTFVFSF